MINSEYGAVSAGGGDRDISWGLRDLTTQLRRQRKIQGFVYTELTDIEWEHNGLVNYDRTPKRFGYDTWLPDMRPNELLGADFVGYDAPPAIVGKPGRDDHGPDLRQPFLRPDVPAQAAVVGQRLRRPRRHPHRGRARGASRSPGGLTTSSSWSRSGSRCRDYPFVGALDPDAPRSEEPAIRRQFRQPGGQARSTLAADPAARAATTSRSGSRPGTSPASNGPSRPSRRRARSTVTARAIFEYRIQVPAAVVKAHPESIYYLFEAASKAKRERVDWPERVNRQDYPQTDAGAHLAARRWPCPSTAGSIERIKLPDDPADARGVLSHLAGVEHGSHGELVDGMITLTDGDRARLAAGEPLVLRLAVPDDAPHAGGLCIFGATTGELPLDPTLDIHTRDPLPDDLGVGPDTAIALPPGP